MTFDELLPLTTGALDGAERAALHDKIVELKRETIASYPRDGNPRLGRSRSTLPSRSVSTELWFELL